MFKADLDNLGAIFSIGLGNRISISRFATLSRTLNYFFSVYVNYSLKEEAKFKDIYTVFSGGDDLCLIGPWNKIIDYALYIQSEFKKFCGNNPSLIISGGISLAGHNLPVKYIAENAKDSLEISKEKGKNRIALFETTVEWYKMEKLMEIAEKLNKWIKDEKISSGQVYRLLKYHKMKNDIEKGQKISRNIIWHSLLRYDVARNIKDENLRDEFLKIICKNIDGIRILACYVIYLNRKN